MNILIVFEIPFKYWHKVVWEEIGNITRLSLEQSELCGPSLCQVAGGTRDAKSWMHSQLSCMDSIWEESYNTRHGMYIYFKYCFWREGKAWLWRKNRPYFISMDRIITVWMLPNSPLPSGCTHCTPGIIEEWLRTTSQHNIYTLGRFEIVTLTTMGKINCWPQWRSLLSFELQKS